MSPTTPLFLLSAFVIVSMFSTAGAAEHGHGHKKMKNDAHGMTAGSGRGTSHDHGKSIDMRAGPSAPTVTVKIMKDAVGGWNVHILTTNFRFAPAHASGSHAPGEGHAHIYANGKKLARVYGNWFHIGSLRSGKTMISVTLNANDHRAFSVDGKPVEATVLVDNSYHTH